MKSAKQTNARIQKWRTMLAVGLHKDQDLLQSRTRKGVPTSLRNIVWPQLLPLSKHIQQRQKEINYEKLVNKLSNNVYEISLDIPRTFPQQEDSKVLMKSLNDVLKAIAIVYPKIGYCQGMNFLTRRILEVLDNEETFWLLHYLFENDKYLRNNFINPSFIEIHDYIFNALLQDYMPELNKQLTRKGVFIQSFTMKSFMTLYSGCLQKQCFDRVFEVYLIQGWSIIYSVALAMFKLHEKQFKSGTMQSLQTTLTTKIFKIDDIDRLMQQAYKFGLGPQKLIKLDKQFKQKKGKNLRQSAQFEQSGQKNVALNKFQPQNSAISQLIFQKKQKDKGNFEILQVLKYRLK